MPINPFDSPLEPSRSVSSCQGLRPYLAATVVSSVVCCAAIGIVCWLGKAEFNQGSLYLELPATDFAGDEFSLSYLIIEYPSLLMISAIALAGAAIFGNGVVFAWRQFAKLNRPADEQPQNPEL